MNNTILLTAVSGVVGTGLGGLLGVLVGVRGRKFISAVLGIASGIMLAVVFFDLMPESMAMSPSPMVSLLGMIWGIVVMIMLGYVVAKIEARINKTRTLISNKNDLTSANRKKLKSAGLFLLLAISLHDIPEGLAIGASDTVAGSLALTMAIVIMIHNIPEGMAISLPLVAGRTNKFVAVLLSTIAGSMTIVGGIIGVLLGGISLTMTSFFLAFAGGAMLQVTVCDMIPNAIDLNKGNATFYCILSGILLGFVINIVM